MIKKITGEAQYNSILASIEKLIVKATAAGGFNFLSEKEKAELGQLSLSAEKFEDYVFKIMPLV